MATKKYTIGNSLIIADVEREARDLAVDILYSGEIIETKRQVRIALRGALSLHRGAKTLTGFDIEKMAPGYFDEMVDKTWQSLRKMQRSNPDDIVKRFRDRPTYRLALQILDEPYSWNTPGIGRVVRWLEGYLYNIVRKWKGSSKRQKALIRQKVKQLTIVYEIYPDFETDRLIEKYGILE